MPVCEAASLKRLLEPELFECFFNCLDSVRAVQYPEGDQDTTLSVDVSRAVMKRFLSGLDYSALMIRGEADMEFHFNIAPVGYTDPPMCKDKVSIHFDPGSCRFRMVVQNTFLVPPNWCTEGTVVYAFVIGRNRVLDFYRNEAG